MPPTAAQLLAERDWMRALARTLVLDDSAAEDLVQDATVVALTRPPRESDALRGWLRRVMRHLHLNRVRGESRRAAREKRAPVRPDVAEPPDIVATWEVRRRVVDAVLALDEPYRTTVLLRFFEGLSRNATAARMGVSPETVHTRQRRAVARLRDRLLEDDDRPRIAPALFLIARGDRGGPLPPATAPATALGVTAVTTTKSALLAAGALAALLLGWVAIDRWTAPSRPTTEVAGGTSTSAVSERVPRRRMPGIDAPPAADTTEAAVPPSPLDRDRDVFGRVLTEDGAPIAGARVRVVRYPQQFAGLAFLEGTFAGREGEQTTTSADGAFRLGLVPGESVHLRVEKPGFATAEFAGRRAGERTDLVLGPAASLAVRVVDPESRPVEDARVMLFTRPDGPDDLVDRFAFGAARTGEDGRHTFGELPVGLSVRIEVTHPAFGAAEWVRATTSRESGRVLDVVLPRGRGLRGRVVDTDGNPIAQAVVGLDRLQRTSVRTAKDGTFVLPGWHGEGEVRATAPGHAPLTLRPAGDAQVEFRLLAAATLTGRLLDPGGAPVPDAPVCAIFDDQRRGLGHSGALTTTDDTGRFTLRDLRADVAHTLRAVVHGSGVLECRVPPTGEPGSTTDLGDLVLVAGRTVTGRVVDADEQPQARVTVRIAPVGPEPSYPSPFRISTDHLGRFRFDHVRPGRYAVTVTREREEVARGEIDVRDDRDPAPLVLGAAPTDDFVVRAVDDGGAPVDGVQVAVVTEAKQRRVATTDGTGVARFALVAPARIVTAALTDRVRTRLYVTPTPLRLSGDVRSTVVVFRRGLEIAGVAVDDLDRPLQGGFVGYDLPGLRGRLAPIASDGTFRLTAPTDTLVDLYFHPAQIPYSADEIRVGTALRVRAPRADVRLVVRKPVYDQRISVRVVDARGAPVAGVRVTVPFLQHATVAGTTGQDGRADLDGLPDSSVHVTALVPGDHPAAALHCLRTWTRVVPEGQEITLALEPGRAITGLVLDDARRPVEGAHVGLDGVPHLAHHRAVSGQGGAFRVMVPRDEEGPFDLRATWWDGTTELAARAVGVAAGAQRVELRPDPR